MCELVNIGTRQKEIETPIFKGSDKLLNDVFIGKISPMILPVELFEFTFLALAKTLEITFGLPSDFKKRTFGFRRSLQMKNNLSIFSGAKTFQHVLELSLGIFDIEGNVLPKNEFQKIGLSINDQYNKNWLSTEQQAAFRQSGSVDDWDQIQQNKDIFPFLVYSTVGDARVRKDHAEIDGVIKSVDDPFWNTWYPPNDWNCRCIVQQLEKATVTKGKIPENESPIFGTNVGKNGLIFPKKHPYFKVPKQFKTAQKNNFGFITPSDKSIKNVGL